MFAFVYEMEIYIYFVLLYILGIKKISESSLYTLSSDIIYSVIALLAISKTRAYFSMHVYYKKSNVPDIVSLTLHSFPNISS